MTLAVQRSRYMTLESIGQLSDDPLISRPQWRADRPGMPDTSAINVASYATRRDSITV